MASVLSPPEAVAQFHAKLLQAIMQNYTFVTTEFNGNCVFCGNGQTSTGVFPD